VLLKNNRMLLRSGRWAKRPVEWVTTRIYAYLKGLLRRAKGLNMDLPRNQDALNRFTPDWSLAAWPASSAPEPELGHSEASHAVRQQKPVSGGGPQTRWLGQSCIVLETVDSTNGFAGRLLSGTKADAASGTKTAPPPGSVILAREQTQGRGQFGTSWYQGGKIPAREGDFGQQAPALPGEGLAMSIVLYPTFVRADRAFLWSMAVAVAAIEALQRLCARAVQHRAAPAAAPLSELRLKWPNDLIWVPHEAEQRGAWFKLGGLLIENSLARKHLTHSIVGLGLNLNQQAFPAALPNPASLRQVDGRERSPEAAAMAFCEALEPRYEQLQLGAEGALKRAYLRHLDGYGTWRRYRAGEEPIEARIAGVADNGRIALEERSGRVRHAFFKEVERVLPEP
jgi:BirA family biotin operon repressor/biotin-[acetyl-CoA-carboxylase] ligase